MKKQALGKGLGALLSVPEPIKVKKETILNEIPLDNIRPNRYQPRREFSDSNIDELASSISQKGVLTPILVRKSIRGYELIAGERRFRAAQKVGLKTIPAIIKDIIEEESLELALIENIQREDLNPIEEAQAYQQLIDRFKLKHEELAQKVGKNRSTITNMLRLLELPDILQDEVSRGTLSIGHARSLLGLTTPQQMAEAGKLVINRNYSVRQTEVLVNRLKSGYVKKSPKAIDDLDIHIRDLEEKIRKRLGVKTQVITRGKGGKIIIEFSSLDELDRILTKFELSG